VENSVFHGDCLTEMNRIGDECVDLVYLDPPFYSNKSQTSVSRNREKIFSFEDSWENSQYYLAYMADRLAPVHRILKATGSVFLHCDSSANYLLRGLLDNIFGAAQFRSEIIWSYRRWSNSARNLLPAHQTIYFYSKTDHYKFNKMFGAYSETTNVDQILQLRGRDHHGVSSYATDESGEIVFGLKKDGVPLSDVWEIPFLNPKAKERTGYPTQKPILLLERIINLVTEPGDTIVDPFCGSGTSLVAATIHNRKSIGIDISADAVDLSRRRVLHPTKTDSALLKKGRSAYEGLNKAALAHLAGMDIVPVQRNAGIDAFWRLPQTGELVPMRIQRSSESIADTVNSVVKAIASKGTRRAIVVRTHDLADAFPISPKDISIGIVDGVAMQVKKHASQFLGIDDSRQPLADIKQMPMVDWR
jgi:site-specific DNA-methyltransferase (adenine-specific)